MMLFKMLHIDFFINLIFLKYLVLSKRYVFKKLKTLQQRKNPKHLKGFETFS